MNNYLNDAKNFKLAIASGKGGVGKSMLTSCLATLFTENYRVVAVDCDVDAPNLAIWLNEVGDWDKEKKISTSEKPIFDNQKCTGCGTCALNCQFKAIEMVDGKSKLNPFLCEGCGACEILCPAKAITMKPVKNGEIRVKKTKYGFNLFSGQLYPGETGSGKVVAELKQEADKFKHDPSANSGRGIMIIDSSPGTGCPVIASLQDANFAILITEPTPSGFSDLKRVLEVVNYFKISHGIVINKWDINKPLAKKIKDWALRLPSTPLGTSRSGQAGKKFLGQISYDQKIFKSVADLIPIMETNLPAVKEIKNIYRNLHSNYLAR